MVKTFGFYINTDDIKRTTIYDNLEVAIKAKELRESLLEKQEEFMFETVLSTDRKLKLLKKAKEMGLKKRFIWLSSKL